MKTMFIDSFDLFFGRRSDWTTRIGGLIFVVAFVWLAAFGARAVHREIINPIVERGDVIGCHYTPARNDMQMIPNGNGGFTYIPSYTPERYFLVREAWRKDRTRTTVKVRTDAATYFDWQQRLNQ